ncbi:MAG: cytochrome c peroxidase, partial [Planctomycetota bacterium]
MRSGNLLATIMVFGTGIALAVGIAALLQPPVAEAKSYGSREAVVELGRRLFMDHTVSRAGQFSCASCHEPEHGFSDPRKVSEDENGKTLRHSQTLIDLKDGTGFHWDGEFDYLHELLVARLAPVPEVMAQTRALVQRHFQVSQTRGDRPSEEQYQKKLRELTPPYYGPDVPSSGTPRPLPQPLVRRLESDGRYDEAFRAAYGSKEPTTERIVESMKAYMLSIQSTPNRHDQYLAGKPEALTASERRGLRLFEGKAACAKCHDSRSINGEKPTFTDYAFRNTGVSFQRAKVSYEKGWELDAGLGAQTFASVDIGRFKVPTLRDVAVRAPYMHDGEFETLEEVVDYYVKGGTNNGGLDRKIHAFELTKKERADLVAFLKSLTGTERAGLGKPTK